MEDETQQQNATATEGKPPEPAQSEGGEDPLLGEMLKAGVLFGRTSSRTNPRMGQFIEITRNGIEIFRHAATLARITAAGDFLEGLMRKGGTVLFVGTTPPSRQLVKALAEKFGFPCVTERWLGGLLTNFKTLSQRIGYYLKLKADREAGRLDQYTKKERLGFAKEIERLAVLFKGLEGFTALPQALFVVNVNAHLIAVREAKRAGIPVVALMSSDANPDFVQYPVPANDSARSSIAWILARIEERIAAGRAAFESAPVVTPGPSHDPQ